MKICKENLIIGSRYIIDKGHPNSSTIILMAIYGNHFCRVKSTDDGEEWDTMINRLSEITNENGNTL